MRAPAFRSWPGIAPDTEARAGALVVCTAVYVVGLQCARMAVHPDEVWRAPGGPTVPGVLGFLGSPLLVMAGFALLSLGVILAARGRGLRTAATLGLQLLALTILLVETSAQVYFFSTGQTLDWPLFWSAVTRPTQVALAGLPSVPEEIWLSLGCTALLVAIVPWVAGWRARKWKSNSVLLSRVRPLALALSVAGLLVAACGFLPTTASALDAAAPRDPILNLIWTAVHPPPPAATKSGDAPELFHVAIALGSADAQSLRNVVVVMLASTRADATTVYNPELQTTPYLAQLAKKSLVVDRMQVGIPATQKALRLALCGFEASPAATRQATALGALMDCLPNLLRAQGYRTLFMQSADENLDLRASSVFSMGFDDFFGPSAFDLEGFERPNQVGWDDESMLGPTRALLKRRSRRPLFATYLTVDAHSDCQPMTRRGHIQFSERADMDCYLNAIRADDFFVHELIRQYEDFGLLQNTLFIIVGDHGEAFGEHGRRTHLDVPWQEALQVPAIIYDPNGVSPAPGHSSGTRSQLDLAPTLVELLGYKTISGDYPGQSLLQPESDERIVHSACNGENSCLASVQGDLKFIDHAGRRPDELFDLKSDPAERHDLSAAMPEVMAKRKAEVRSWDEEVKARYAWFIGHRAGPVGR